MQIESLVGYSCEMREAGSWGRGQFGNPEEKEGRSPLEADTKQRLVKTEKTTYAVVTVIFGVSNELRLS
jgi:hypothetical protein